MKQRLLAFDTWLLERYPLLWHSKLIYLLLLATLMWGGYFLAGYLTVDLAFLKTEQIRDYFFESIAVVIHVLLCIMLLTFWALAFYKKGPLRYYYPVGRFYLLKLFALIHIGLFPIGLCHLPFEAGMTLKARTVIDIRELNNDLDAANLAMAFLPDEQNRYQLSDRVYPHPFPLEINVYDKNEQAWEDESQPQADGTRYKTRMHPENTVVLSDSNAYQFYTEKMVFHKGRCGAISESVIERFYQLDTATPLFSVLNFSTCTFDTTARALRYSEGGSSQFFGKTYAPRIHSWINNNQKDSVLQAIVRFEKVLDRYAIPYFIQDKWWVNVLEQRNYNIPFSGIVAHDISAFEAKAQLSYFQSIGADFDRFETDREMDNAYHLMGFNRYQLEHLHENTYWAHYKRFDHEQTYLFVLLICFIVSALLLLFSFTPIIQLIIAIPSGLALLIVTSLIGSSLVSALTRSNDSGYFYAFGYLLLIFLIVAAGVVGLTLLSFRRKAFGKKLSGVLLNLSYVIAPVLLPLALFTIDELLKYRAWSYCRGTYIVHGWTHGLLTPGVIIGLGYLGFIAYLGTIKWWFAKAE